MFPDTKIVQAEGRTKFIWDLPRRRLSKRRLVLRKVVQAEGRTKFIWDLPRRRLSKRRLVLRKVVQAEGRTKFIWVLPRRCLSKRRLVLRKVVQAERKSKRSLRFCRGAAYLSGGLSSAKSCKPSAKANLFADLPRRAFANPDGSSSPAKIRTNR